MNVIAVSNLYKSFGEKIAVNNLNMEVQEGNIYGFLGPNGAGKTTTLRMLAGLARPDKGEIRIYDKKIIFGKQYGFKIGYLHDAPEFPAYMSGRSFLRFMGELCGFKGKKLNSRVDEVLELVGLNNEKSSVGGYSRGMKQRLGVAQALIGSPKVMIMDEPFSALDPLGRKEIIDLIKSISSMVTVLFSTHILSDADRICDTIGIINNGRLLIEADKEEMKKKFSARKIVLTFDSAPARFAGLIQKELPGCEIAQDHSIVSILGKDELEIRKKVQKMLAEESAVIRRLEIFEPSLEDIFVRLVHQNE